MLRRVSRQRAQEGGPRGDDWDTVEFIEQLLGPEAARAGADLGDGQGAASGTLAMVAKTAALVYGSAVVVTRGTRWLLGYRKPKAE
jgi:hypothetical protein